MSHRIVNMNLETARLINKSDIDFVNLLKNLIKAPICPNESNYFDGNFQKLLTEFFDAKNMDDYATIENKCIHLFKHIVKKSKTYHSTIWLSQVPSLYYLLGTCQFIQGKISAAEISYENCRKYILDHAPIKDGNKLISHETELLLTAAVLSLKYIASINPNIKSAMKSNRYHAKLSLNSELTDNKYLYKKLNQHLLKFDKTRINTIYNAKNKLSESDGDFLCQLLSSLAKWKLLKNIVNKTQQQKNEYSQNKDTLKDSLLKVPELFCLIPFNIKKYPWTSELTDEDVQVLLVDIVAEYIVSVGHFKQGNRKLEPAIYEKIINTIIKSGECIPLFMLLIKVVERIDKTIENMDTKYFIFCEFKVILIEALKKLNLDDGIHYIIDNDNNTIDTKILDILNEKSKNNLLDNVPLTDQEKEPIETCLRKLESHILNNEYDEALQLELLYGGFERTENKHDADFNFWMTILYFKLREVTKITIPVNKFQKECYDRLILPYMKETFAKRSENETDIDVFGRLNKKITEIYGTENKNYLQTFFADYKKIKDEIARLSAEKKPAANPHATIINVMPINTPIKDQLDQPQKVITTAAQSQSSFEIVKKEKELEIDNEKQRIKAALDEAERQRVAREERLRKEAEDKKQAEERRKEEERLRKEEETRLKEEEQKQVEEIQIEEECLQKAEETPRREEEQKQVEVNPKDEESLRKANETKLKEKEQKQSDENQKKQRRRQMNEKDRVKKLHKHQKTKRKDRDLNNLMGIAQAEEYQSINEIIQITTDIKKINLEINDTEEKIQKFKVIKDTLSEDKKSENNTITIYDIQLQQTIEKLQVEIRKNEKQLQDQIEEKEEKERIQRAQEYLQGRKSSFLSQFFIDQGDTEETNDMACLLKLNKLFGELGSPIIFKGSFVVKWYLLQLGKIELSDLLKINDIDALILYLHPIKTELLIDSMKDLGFRHLKTSSSYINFERKLKSGYKFEVSFKLDSAYIVDFNDLTSGKATLNIKNDGTPPVLEVDTNDFMFQRFHDACNQGKVLIRGPVAGGPVSGTTSFLYRLLKYLIQYEGIIEIEGVENALKECEFYLTQAYTNFSEEVVNPMLRASNPIFLELREFFMHSNILAHDKAPPFLKLIFDIIFMKMGFSYANVDDFIQYLRQNKPLVNQFKLIQHYYFEGQFKQFLNNYMQKTYPEEYRYQSSSLIYPSLSPYPTSKIMLLPHPGSSPKLYRPITPMHAHSSPAHQVVSDSIQSPVPTPPSSPVISNSNILWRKKRQGGQRREKQENRKHNQAHSQSPTIGRGQGPGSPKN